MFCYHTLIPEVIKMTSQNLSSHADFSAINTLTEVREHQKIIWPFQIGVCQKEIYF